jgi:uncharacterized protein
MRATLTITALRGLWLALLFGLAVAAHDARAAEPDWPALTGHVVDDAGLLSPDQRSGLDAKLAGFESSWGSQLVVVTVKSLQGLTIEEYGLGLGRHWGIGQIGKNDGAMLIVAPNDRAVRIEVGYGLEGVLTDAICSSIIQSDILPAFRAGHMGEGIVAGTDSILTALSGDYTPSQWADADTGLPAATHAPPSQPAGGPDFPFWLVPLIFVLFWLAIVMLMNRFRGKRGTYRSGWGLGRASRSFGSSGFSGSSGSGFSGGGGSFGGGGSSGRW